MKKYKFDNSGWLKKKKDLKKREKLLKILQKKRRKLQYKQQGHHPPINDLVSLKKKSLRNNRSSSPKNYIKTLIKPLNKRPAINYNSSSDINALTHNNNNSHNNESENASNTQNFQNTQNSQKFNIIEKLIKLDRKYCNFDIIYYKSKKKLKIRNQIGVSVQNTLQNNYGMRTYWKHMAQFYFKPLEQTDIFRINYLQSMTNLPIKKKQMKYADMNSYQAVKKVIQKNNYLNSYLNQDLNKLNYNNLLKHILISTKLSYLTNHYKQDLSNDDLNELDHSSEILHKKYMERNFIQHRKDQNYESQKDQIKFESEQRQFFDNEAKHLDQIIKIINCQEQNEDSIDRELDKLIAEVKCINKQNRESLNKLRKDIDKELQFSKGYPFTLRNDLTNSWKYCFTPYYEINDEDFFTITNYSDLQKNLLIIDNQQHQQQQQQEVIYSSQIQQQNKIQLRNHSPVKSRKILKLLQQQAEKFTEIIFQQNQMIVIDDITFYINAFNEVGLEVQKEYFKYTILFLEAKQLIESISFIKDVKKNDKRQLFFEVKFEESYEFNQNWMEEQLLINLDKYREQSLFSSYLIPTKSTYSYIAQNFYGFDKILQKKSKEIEKGQTLIKYMRNIRENFQQNIASSKQNQFNVCHHCKLFYNKEELITCKYRSNINGHPVNNFVLQEPSLYNLGLEKNAVQQISPINRKRNTFSFFNRKNGQLNCVRSFCKQCLKQNYDLNIAEVKSKNDWTCPFCQGICYCTRCIRNEMILKLKNFSSSIGLELQNISKSSIFERFMKAKEASSELKIQKNKFEKIDKNSMIKQKGEEQEEAKRQQNDQVRNDIIQAVKLLKKRTKQFERVKKIRINMEKLRILSSQVLRREKIKTKINYLEQDIFEQQLKFIQEQGIVFNQDLTQIKKKKGRKRKIKINFEDKINQIQNDQLSNESQSEEENEESQYEQSQSGETNLQNISRFQFEHKTPTTTSYISRLKDNINPRVQKKIKNSDIFQLSQQSQTSNNNFNNLAVSNPNLNNSQMLQNFVKKRDLKVVQKFQKNFNHCLKRDNLLLKQTDPKHQLLSKSQQFQYLVKKQSLNQHENPNEPDDQKFKQPKLKKELFKIFEYQDPKQFSLLFNENIKEDNINKKLLRSKTGVLSQLSGGGSSQTYNNNNSQYIQNSQNKNK